MKTLVIHLSDPSTDFLSPIYAGQPWSVMRRPFSRDVVEACNAHDRVIMLGHGSPSGLFGGRELYAVSRMTVEALRGKPNIYIWCHADQFVEHHGLSGFYTGMFISEVGEASFCGVQATQEEVDASNEEFVQIVARHINESPGAVCQAVRRDYFAGRAVADYNRRLVNFQ